MPWSTKVYATFFLFFWLEKIKYIFSYALLPKFFLQFFSRKFTCWQKINFKNEVKKTSQPYREKKRIIALASRAQIVCFLPFFFLCAFLCVFRFSTFVDFPFKSILVNQNWTQRKIFPIGKKTKTLSFSDDYCFLTYSLNERST